LAFRLREELSIKINGPLCYLALNWMPVKVDLLPVDAHTLHEYEIRYWIRNGMAGDRKG
jgi:hypothetical protein